jgi:type II secretory pathway pseudopilin PulG
MRNAISQSGVTPLGLAMAVLIIILLAAAAIPRLQAVSEERRRPEATPILSAFPTSAMSDTGCGGAVSRGVSER